MIGFIFTRRRLLIGAKGKISEFLRFKNKPHIDYAGKSLRQVLQENIETICSTYDYYVERNRLELSAPYPAVLTYPGEYERNPYSLRALLEAVNVINEHPKFKLVHASPIHKAFLHGWTDHEEILEEPCAVIDALDSNPKLVYFYQPADAIYNPEEHVISISSMDTSAKYPTAVLEKEFENQGMKISPADRDLLFAQIIQEPKVSSFFLNKEIEGKNIEVKIDRPRSSFSLGVDEINTFLTEHLELSKLEMVGISKILLIGDTLKKGAFREYIKKDLGLKNLILEPRKFRANSELKIIFKGAIQAASGDEASNLPLLNGLHETAFELDSNNMVNEDLVIEQPEDLSIANGVEMNDFEVAPQDETFKISDFEKLTVGTHSNINTPLANNNTIFIGEDDFDHALQNGQEKQGDRQGATIIESKLDQVTEKELPVEEDKLFETDFSKEEKEDSIDKKTNDEEVIELENELDPQNENDSQWNISDGKLENDTQKTPLAEKNKTNTLSKANAADELFDANEKSKSEVLADEIADLIRQRGENKNLAKLKGITHKNEKIEDPLELNADHKFNGAKKDLENSEIIDPSIDVDENKESQLENSFRIDLGDSKDDSPELKEEAIQAEKTIKGQEEEVEHDEQLASDKTENQLDQKQIDLEPTEVITFPQSAEEKNQTDQLIDSQKKENVESSSESDLDEENPFASLKERLNAEIKKFEKAAKERAQAISALRKQEEERLAEIRRQIQQEKVISQRLAEERLRHQRILQEQRDVDKENFSSNDSVKEEVYLEKENDLETKRREHEILRKAERERILRKKIEEEKLAIEYRRIAEENKRKALERELERKTREEIALKKKLEFEKKAAEARLIKEKEVQKSREEELLRQADQERKEREKMLLKLSERERKLRERLKNTKSVAAKKIKDGKKMRKKLEEELSHYLFQEKQEDQLDSTILNEVPTEEAAALLEAKSSEATKELETESNEETLSGISQAGEELDTNELKEATQNEIEDETLNPVDKEVDEESSLNKVEPALRDNADQASEDFVEESEPEATEKAKEIGIEEVEIDLAEETMPEDLSLEKETDSELVKTEEEKKVEEDKVESVSPEEPLVDAIPESEDHDKARLLKPETEIVASDEEGLEVENKEIEEVKAEKVDAVLTEDEVKEAVPKDEDSKVVDSNIEEVESNVSENPSVEINNQEEEPRLKEVNAKEEESVVVDKASIEETVTVEEQIKDDTAQTESKASTDSSIEEESVKEDQEVKESKVDSADPAPEEATIKEKEIDVKEDDLAHVEAENTEILSSETPVEVDNIENGLSQKERKIADELLVEEASQTKEIEVKDERKELLESESIEESPVNLEQKNEENEVAKEEGKVQDESAAIENKPDEPTPNEESKEIEGIKDDQSESALVEESLNDPAEKVDNEEIEKSETTQAASEDTLDTSIDKAKIAEEELPEETEGVQSEPESIEKASEEAIPSIEDDTDKETEEELPESKEKKAVAKADDHTLKDIKDGQIEEGQLEVAEGLSLDASNPVEEIKTNEEQGSGSEDFKENQAGAEVIDIENQKEPLELVTEASSITETVIAEKDSSTEEVNFSTEEDDPKTVKRQAELKERDEKVAILLQKAAEDRKKRKGETEDKTEVEQSAESLEPDDAKILLQQGSGNLPPVKEEKQSETFTIDASKEQDASNETGNLEDHVSEEAQRRREALIASLEQLEKATKLDPAEENEEPPQDMIEEESEESENDLEIDVDHQKTEEPKEAIEEQEETTKSEDEKASEPEPKEDGAETTQNDEALAPVESKQELVKPADIKQKAEETAKSLKEKEKKAQEEIREMEKALKATEKRIEKETKELEKAGQELVKQTKGALKTEKNPVKSKESAQVGQAIAVQHAHLPFAVASKMMGDYFVLREECKSFDFHSYVADPKDNFGNRKIIRMITDGELARPELKESFQRMYEKEKNYYRFNNLIQNAPGGAKYYFRDYYQGVSLRKYIQKLNLLRKRSYKDLKSNDINLIHAVLEATSHLPVSHRRLNEDHILVFAHKQWLRRQVDIHITFIGFTGEDATKEEMTKQVESMFERVLSPGVYADFKKHILKK